MKTILFAAIIALSPIVEAQQVRVYCQDMFGRVTIHTGQCPFGYTFIGVVER